MPKSGPQLKALKPRFGLSLSISLARGTEVRSDRFKCCFPRSECLQFVNKALNGVKQMSRHENVHLWQGGTACQRLKNSLKFRRAII